MDKQKLAGLVGEKEYAGGSFVYFDEVRFDKQKGEFSLIFTNEGKQEDGTYKTEALGSSIKVIFLKIRRKMIEFDMGMLKTISNEYNSKSEVVKLSNGEVGIEKELKTKFPSLKVNVIIYALLVRGKTTSVVKFTVSGASLYSDNPEGPVRFYNYLQSFGRSEHSFEYMTTVTPTKEVFHNKKENKDVPYYAFSFIKGAKKLNDAQLVKVGGDIEEVSALLDEVDAKAKDPFLPKAKVKEEATGGVEYPKEEINADDIPF